MIKQKKSCSQCDTKYTVTWDEEEQDLDPLTCPFCGYEVEDEEDIEQRYEPNDSWD